MLIAHDVFTSLVVNRLLGLIQTVFNGFLDLAEVLLNSVLEDVEAHEGLLSARLRALK